MEGSIEDIVDEEPDAQAELEPGTLAEEADQDAPIIKLVHSIIAQAVQHGASDIHISPEEGDAKVLFRVDGVLAPAATVRRRMVAGVISRIKIMGDLDIAEKRVPQDGRFALTVEGRRVDIRVVSLPLVHGEAVVLRILDKGVTVESLQSLGMGPDELRRFEHAISKPNGAILVTGPTGSGKSTTLYGALNVLNDGERSILTIEDPVEQRMAGVKQMQIAPKAGVTFDVGLRSMLRADPDVIMVGEIRDRETAHIAVEAALTGHLVLSTLHTRDAPSALGRLLDMSIEPFLISSAIDCIVAQRLVRMLCTHCRRPQQLSEEVLAEHGLTGAQPYEAVGCSRCGGSGYRGRVGLYEVMTVSERIRSLVLAHGSVDDIAAAAEADGHGAAARRRHRQGARRADLDRRDRAHDQQFAVVGPGRRRQPGLERSTLATTLSTRDRTCFWRPLSTGRSPTRRNSSCGCTTSWRIASSANCMSRSLPAVSFASTRSWASMHQPVACASWPASRGTRTGTSRCSHRAGALAVSGPTPCA